MDRKLIYLVSLLVFFLMWGVFGFIAAAPSSEPSSEVPPRSVEGPHAVPGSAEDQELIPVTGETQREARTPGVYILAAFVALLLVLAVLNTLNKPATTYVRDKDRPHES